MTGCPNSIEIKRRFNATPEAVFDAWTDPALAGRWLFTSPTSERHDTQLDVRGGGRWTITDRRGGVDYTALGEYLEVDRPRRLAFTFGMPQFSPAFGKVNVTFEADGDGCLMTLAQEDLPPEHHAATIEGWEAMFDGLAGALI
jgi:uncharacterized protein YndB with AHSA1/START domain